MALEGVHGERVHLSGAVTVAHPLLLAEIGLLADWQTEIVRQQIVQPFKQVFREQYVLTPAEVSATYASARLAWAAHAWAPGHGGAGESGWIVDGGGTGPQAVLYPGLRGALRGRRLLRSI